MDSLEITKTPDPAASATGDVRSAVSGSCCAPPTSIQPPLRSWISDWRVLAVAGLAVTGTGLGLGWNWLTAVGIAPIIVSTAPCLIMCALGVCMMGRGHEAASTEPASGAVEPSRRTDPPGSP